jgi:hypothetical protein
VDAFLEDARVFSLERYDGRAGAGVQNLDVQKHQFRGCPKDGRLVLSVECEQAEDDESIPDTTSMSHGVNHVIYSNADSQESPTSDWKVMATMRRPLSSKMPRQWSGQLSHL